MIVYRRVTSRLPSDGRDRPAGADRPPRFRSIASHSEGQPQQGDRPAIL